MTRLAAAAESLDGASDKNSPVKDRTILLQHCIEAHTFSFQRAVAWVFVNQYKLTNGAFDYQNHYVEFKMDYRPECDGNPALAFRARCMHLRQISDLREAPLVQSALEACRATDEKEDERRRVKDPNCIGRQFKALFVTEELALAFIAHKKYRG